ncbi:hypothetical protein HPB51_022777 [Rhipicephalus microplus]|uniref:Brinker DNA-binding domain-containing protein n=1 Tax=Rhipicephalus microplus TaxID=6941 RepID=A0A9J6ED48_RHIMP|nr:hypothetical protein HPB51_022777 [Rhipicephalus microplus]
MGQHLRSFTAAFKLLVIDYAEEHGKCEAGRKYDVDEKHGKRHQRALKSQGTIQESTDVSSAKPLDGSASSVSGSNQAPAEDLSCEYCGIVLFKSMEYKLLHLETEAHRKDKQWPVTEQGYQSDEPLLKRPKTDYSKSEVTGGPNGRYDEYGGAYDQYSEYPTGASQYDGYGGL